jgi:hypothetical protein
MTSPFQISDKNKLALENKLESRGALLHGGRAQKKINGKQKIPDCFMVGGTAVVLG